MENIEIQQLLSELRDRFVPSLYLDETKKKPKSKKISVIRL